MGKQTSGGLWGIMSSILFTSQDKVNSDDGRLSKKDRFFLWRNNKQVTQGAALCQHTGGRIQLASLVTQTLSTEEAKEGDGDGQTDKLKRKKTGIKNIVKHENAACQSHRTCEEIQIQMWHLRALISVRMETKGESTVSCHRVISAAAIQRTFAYSFWFYAPQRHSAAALIHVLLMWPVCARRHQLARVVEHRAAKRIFPSGNNLSSGISTISS